jgi:hypothetical protein
MAKKGWWKALWSEEGTEEDMPEWARVLWNPEYRKRRKKMKEAMKQRKAVSEGRALTEEQYTGRKK